MTVHDAKQCFKLAKHKAMDERKHISQGKISKYYVQKHQNRQK